MKKLLFLLFALPLFISCGSDEPDKPKQDYTSFVFEQTVDNVLPNCKAAYLNNEGFFIKIADLGTIDLNTPSKEIKVTDDKITEIYFFTDYAVSNSETIGNRIDAVYKLTKNEKKNFKLLESVKGTDADKNDPKQYPQ